MLSNQKKHGAICAAGMLVAGFVVLAAAAPARAAGVVARATAVVGDVSVQGLDGGRRPLHCGDSVRSGERLFTAADGRTALLSGDVLVQLDVNSEAVLETTEVGTPALMLARGHLRLIDGRAGETGPELRISTPHAKASGFGGDSDIYITAVAGTEQSLLCASERTLAVQRAQDQTTAQPGECVVAQSGGGAFSRAPHPRVAIDTGGGTCEVVSLQHLFLPTEVAVGPPAGGELIPLQGPGLSRDACDDPGSGCSGDVQSPPPSEPPTASEEPGPATPPAPPTCDDPSECFENCGDPSECFGDLSLQAGD